MPVAIYKTTRPKSTGIQVVLDAKQPSKILNTGDLLAPASLLSDRSNYPCKGDNIMTTSVIIAVTLFLITVVIIYLRNSIRNLAKSKSQTPAQYLWKLKQITGKSEYELFLIAAEEKGWPEYHVERHFRRYLEDEVLPEYVKDFLEDGQEYIDNYRSKRGNIFQKRVLIFYSFFGLVIIGGSFITGLYIFPKISPFDQSYRVSKSNPARPHIHRAGLYAQDREYEKACLELKRACELGECEYYNRKINEGICQ